ncbi:PP2C family protein-serine/threonine phosphatase [Fusibacter bizertensis]
MGESKERSMERKMYIVSVSIAMAVLIFNNLFVFDKLMDYTIIYFVVVLLINLVVITLLANATYYTSRVKIDEIYVAISFFIFIMIVNTILAVVVILLAPINTLEIVTLLLGFGKLFFIAGVVTLNLQRRLIWLYSSPIRMFFAMIFMIAVELIIVFLSVNTQANQEIITFLIHGLSVMLLVVLNYELVLKEKSNNTYAFLFAFSTMLIAQLFLALSIVSYYMQIQSYILQTLGFIFFFYQINRNNFVIPEGEQKVLQRQFNLYAMNLKKIIDKKTYQVREVNQKFIDELDYAKKIQQSLLPSPKSYYRDVKIFSEYMPCERLSGDFYDHYRLDDDNIALYLMDVSGHGISAALLTMFSSNYLKFGEKNQQLFRGLKPERMLGHFYDQFNKMNFPDEMHMVAFYATMNLSTKMLTYCSAGLNCSPIRIKKNGKVDFLDKSEGFPICRLSEFITPEFRSEKIKLEKGDRLLFFTDGLIDDEKNNTFNNEELIKFLTDHRFVPIEELNDLIVSIINPLKDALNDDITYILMEI